MMTSLVLAAPLAFAIALSATALAQVELARDKALASRRL
jgi:hypothetical protein